MGWGFWSQSGCGRPDVWNYDSAQGMTYWCQRFGAHFMSRSGGSLSLFLYYAGLGYECGTLGPPVKDYGWVSEFGRMGIWCEFGVILWEGDRWVHRLGDWGQTAGR